MKYDFNDIVWYQDGFTLLELLIAMTISGIVMAGVILAYQNQQESHTVQNQGVAMQQTLRASLDLMTREIRMAGFNPEDISDSSGSGIGLRLTGDGSDFANRFEFTYADPDDVDDPNDVISRFFYLDGNNIRTTPQANGEDIIAESISRLQFTYIDQDCNVTADMDEIRAIQITLQATSPSSERKLVDDRSLSAVIKIRNIKM